MQHDTVDTLALTSNYHALVTSKCDTVEEIVSEYCNLWKQWDSIEFLSVIYNATLAQVTQYPECASDLIRLTQDTEPLEPTDDFARLCVDDCTKHIISYLSTKDNCLIQLLSRDMMRMARDVGFTSSQFTIDISTHRFPSVVAMYPFRKATEMKLTQSTKESSVWRGKIEFHFVCVCVFDWLSVCACVSACVVCVSVCA